MPLIYRLTAFLVIVFLGTINPARAQQTLTIDKIPQVFPGLSTATFSSDGSRVITGGASLALWDVATGALLRTFPEKGGEAIALSPSGVRVLVGFGETLNIRDALTGHLIRSFVGGENIQSVAFSPDGSRIVAAGRSVWVWNTQTGDVINKFSIGNSGYEYCDQVVYSHSGVTAVCRDIVFGWGTDGQLRNSFDTSSGAFRAAAISPDGKQVVIGNTTSGTTTISYWEVSSGRLLRPSATFSPGIKRLSFSKDGTRLLVVCHPDDDHVTRARIMDAQTGNLFTAIAADDGYALSPNGTTLIAKIADAKRMVGPRPVFSVESGRLAFLDVTTREVIRDLGGAATPAFSLAVTERRLIAGYVDGTIRVWDAGRGEVVLTRKLHAAAVNAITAQGVLAASADYDGKIVIWNAETGLVLRELTEDGVALAIALSPDGRRILLGGLDGKVRLRDVGTGSLVRTFIDPANARSVHSVAFAQKGTQVIAASAASARATVWITDSGKIVRSFSHAGSSLLTESHVGDNNEYYNALSLSPNGRFLVSYQEDGFIQVWDTQTGKVRKSFKGLEWPLSAVISEGGTHILAGGMSGWVALWDVAKGEMIQQFNADSELVRAVQLSSEGRHVVAASVGSPIRVWSAESSSALAILIGDRNSEWLSMTPEGFFAASPKGEEMLKIVRGFEVYSVMQFYKDLYRPPLIGEMLRVPKSDPESKHHNAASNVALEKILDSGSPPQIKILDHEKRGDVVQLRLRVTDVGGGIGQEIWWRVNGVTKGVSSTPGLDALPGRYVVVSQELPLEAEGKNELEIIAFNGQGLLATRPLRRSVDALGVRDDERPRLYVLTIGIDKYQKEGWKLSHAVQDATELAKALKTVGNPVFLPENIILVPPLLDEKATETGIANAFGQLAAVVKSRDVFVLFVSGHGQTIEGKDWYFLPADFNTDIGHTTLQNGISFKKWRDWLARIRAGKSLIILDSCSAGGAIKSADQDELKSAVAQLVHHTGRHTIAAAPQGKAAFEGYREHGVLTYAILEALHKPEGAPAEQVSVFGVAATVNRLVPDISQKEFNWRQEPKVELGAQDFPFGLRAPVLPDTGPASSAAIALKEIEVRNKPDASGVVKGKLERGDEVRVTNPGNSWSLVVRGPLSGYVPSDALLTIRRP